MSSKNELEIVNVKYVKGTPYVDGKLVRLAKVGRNVKTYYVKNGKRIYFIL